MVARLFIGFERMSVKIHICKQPFERKPSRRCHYNKRGVAKRGFRSKDEAERFIEAKGLKGYGAYRCKVCELWHVGRRASPGPSKEG